MIVWLNGTHGAGRTTVGALVQPLIPDSHVFDAEKIGEALMHLTPALLRPTTSNTGRRDGRSWSGPCSSTPAASS